MTISCCTSPPKNTTTTHKTNTTQKELQGVAESLGAYDNDKGIKHTRESLVAKLESLPKGNDEFEWNRIQAIQHLKQGNPLRARYYMAKMKRGEQGVAEGVFDIFKKLPAPGSTVKIAGRPVEITHAGVGSDYIGFAWTDKNGKEHYEETSADKHSNLRSLAKTIASEIEYADEGVAEEYDPSYDPEYRGYQKPEQDPDAWKQDRDNADEKESTSIVYVIDNETDEVVLKFKSTGGYYGDVRHALKHGYDTEGPDYGIKWKRMQNETATAGATSAGNVGVGAVYKNKPAKQAKNKDGTAKNALDMKANLLTGGSIKR